MKVSRNRPETADRRRKSKAKPETVGLAVIHTVEGMTGCSCGWQFHHPREKVLGDRSQSHVDRKHAGRGIWL